jgi:hypothetical protein
MKLKAVFGVSKDPVASYIEREPVDAALADALSGTRQIIIYGSSKQGKTALLQRHLPEDRRITVHCGPTTSAEDIYRSFLRQSGVEIETDKSSTTGRELNASISAKFTAMIPIFAKAEAKAEGGAKASNSETVSRQKIEFNLAVAQDVGELLLKLKSSENFYVLENFHYLAEEVRSQLAFDLRTFEEMGLRFIVLGVWKERNRLVQYNGDLQDRVAEVPVEPWEDADFERIAGAGEAELNVSMSPAIKQRIFKEAHGSVAIVQELLLKVCETAGVEATVGTKVVIDDPNFLEKAIAEKISEYSLRHVRSLEAIAAGSRSRRATEETAALFLPYYFVRVMVERSYDELKNGVERKTLQELIRAMHSSPGNVRTSDVTGMLARLPSLQGEAKIVPPLFDFDRGTRRVKVVDSTLYFFIDNCNPSDVMAEIPHPDPAAVEGV